VKLSPCSSATLPELFEELLSEPRLSLVRAEANPAVRSLLFDFAINQGFRRDLFLKGEHPLTTLQHRERLAALRFDTSLGAIEDEAGGCRRIAESLAGEPQTLEALCLELEQPPEALLPRLALLIDDGWIGFARGVPGERAVPRAPAHNATLKRLLLEGGNCPWLLAPELGSALAFSPLDAFFLEVWQQGVDAESMPACVGMGLAAAGADLRDDQGRTITEAQEQWEHLERGTRTFLEVTLPRLQRLGALPGDPAGA
jgi:hypothetical protein